MIKKVTIKTPMKRYLIFSIFMFAGLIVFAQQDPLFTQYTFNKLLVNPAYAGSREDLTLNVVNRTQWISIDGAPNTLTLSAHKAVKDKNVGFGLYILRDAIGPTTNTSLMGTYSYRILLANSFFSFGLQGGVNYFDFAWNEMNLRDEDYLFDPANVRKITPDVNVGFYYQSQKFFAGLSSKHLLENDYGFVTEGYKSTFTRLSRHFYLMAGGVVPLRDKILFRPSALVKFVRNAPVQFDVTGCIIFKNSLMVGASFRTEKAVTLMTEVALTDKIRLGYSYDIYFNELQLYNYGSSEIRLEFDIRLFESRMVTPRYF